MAAFFPADKDMLLQWVWDRGTAARRSVSFATPDCLPAEKTTTWTLSMIQLKMLLPALSH